MATNSAVAQLKVEEEPVESRTHLARALNHLKHDRLTLAAIALVLGITILSFIAPLLSNTFIHGLSFEDENLNINFRAPFASEIWEIDKEEVEIFHLLGTDEQGRDVFIRLLYAGQVSLQIAFFAAMLSLGIGVSVGILTGYFGGIIDDFVIWFITTLNSIPALFLLLIVYALFRPGPVELILVLGLIGWTGTMRLVRGETLSLRDREFVIAARAMGASNLRIMFMHIFPNLLSIVVIALAIDIGVLILVESGLSFLGFGIQPPVPSWGNMLTNGRIYAQKAAYLVWIPGIMISITVLCLYIIGDGVRDALDPTIAE